MESLHRNQPVLHRGATIESANAAIILLHGRGASAEDILGLVNEFQMPGMAFLAPEAAGHTWYPNSFLAPIERNEPWLGSALDLIAAILQKLNSSGIPAEKVALMGFSQGACLSTEFVARNPRRYAGLVAFTGGLIGPEGTAFHYPGDLEGTPCFLGSGDPDPHVPWQRVQDSATVLSALTGKVTLKRYPGMPHTISADEISQAKNLLASAF